MKPLITIAMFTYNQARYVGEAVRSLLAQDYEPLEVIVSDDCSTDDTWSVVQAEVRQYRQQGGRHRVVLNRNVDNRGIVRHFQTVLGLMSGELLVTCGGDDISMPNRVSEIVAAWEQSGRAATLIHHGYREMDVGGRDLGEHVPWNAECAHGATVAYAAKVFRAFPMPNAKVTVEDQVWAKRALALGPEIVLPKVLVRYRVGCGMSTKFVNAREFMYRHANDMALACEQVLEDLRQTGGDFPWERVRVVREMCERKLAEAVVDRTLSSSVSFSEKWAALKQKHAQGRLPNSWLGKYVFGLAYLEPFWLGELQRQLYRWLSQRMKPL